MMTSPRSRNEIEAVRTATTLQKALNEVLRYAPVTARARAGVLGIAATTGRDTDAPLDEDGNPLEPTAFFRAGMRVGSAPIKAK